MCNKKFSSFEMVSSQVLESTIKRTHSNKERGIKHDKEKAPSTAQNSHLVAKYQ